MKKLCVIFAMVALLLLSSCTANTRAFFEEPAYILTMHEKVFEGGMLYQKNFNNNIFYLDFTTGKSSPFCPKTNCSHEDNTCSAFLNGEEAQFFIAGKNFYTLNKPTQSVYSKEENRFIANSELYISDLSRTGQRKLATLKGESAFGTVILYKNYACFFSYESVNGFTKGDYSQLNLTVVDLVKNEVTSELPLSIGYSNNLTDFLGADNDSLYIKTSHLEKPVDYASTEAKDISKQIHAATINTYYKINPDKNSLDKLEKGFPTAFTAATTQDSAALIKKEHIVYEEKGYKHKNLKTGNEILITDEEIQYYFTYKDSFIYHVGEEDLFHYEYNLVSGNRTKIYFTKDNLPFGTSSGFLWDDNNYIYATSSTLNKKLKGYDDFETIYILAKKDEITTEGYKSEICS